MEYALLGLTVVVILVAVVLVLRIKSLKSKTSLEMLAQHEALQDSLLNLNEVMKEQESKIKFELALWHDLNDAILEYITHFYNESDLDDNVKFDGSMTFLKECKTFLHKVLTSPKQQEFVVDFTAQLRANKPMFGIRP